MWFYQNFKNLNKEERFENMYMRPIYLDILIPGLLQK